MFDADQLREQIRVAEENTPQPGKTVLMVTAGLYFVSTLMVVLFFASTIYAFRTGNYLVSAWFLSVVAIAFGVQGIWMGITNPFEAMNRVITQIEIVNFGRWLVQPNRGRRFRALIGGIALLAFGIRLITLLLR